MMGLIGKKVGMTQLFDEKGDIIPVTVIEAGPCTVTEVRSLERDGYSAVQIGFGTNKESRYTRPLLGQYKKRNLPPSRHLKEFRIPDSSGFQVGQTIKAELFAKGEYVDVRGVTKGRGFAGVVKRHGFVAGHASHGPTFGKQPGSIGSSAYPSRVIKGKRLPGRMGGVYLTIKNLEVVGVDSEQNYVLVRGAIPGPPNGLVYIQKREG
ncbi:MAG: 50S ribosomal protein L3 [Candidatus Eisenbacteria bacterium]|jgi:large subunit ribosomal protein L3|nr:50S ribosomal protein L3 [Candidatus Eisenbacteria bacterium]